MSQSVGVLEQQYQLQVSEQAVDLQVDPTRVHLTIKNFDFGMRLQYVNEGNEPQIAKTID